MGIGFITAFDFAVVWLVRRMDVGMFLAIRRVREPTITARKLTLERLLSCFVVAIREEIECKRHTKHETFARNINKLTQSH